MAQSTPLGQPASAVHLATAHLVFVADRGQGTHRIDFEEHPIGPDTILHVQPGQVHQAGRTGTAETTVVLLSAHGDDELFAGFPLQPRLLQSEGHHDLRTAIDELRGLLSQSHPTRRALTECEDLILARLARTVHQHRVDYSSQAQLVRQFRCEVESSYAHERRVGFYAQQIGVSARTLGRAVSAGTGQSPKELIDARVALAAKRRLALTTETVAEVGAVLGFSESSNFASFFQRCAGVSPRTFRERLGPRRV